MSKAEEYLTPEEEQEVVNAIGMAEKNTSGEIRVHIEKHTSLDPYSRAKEVFHLLKMDETQQKNGVLIYIAIENRAFAICGDKGINDVVPKDFWDTTRDIMTSHFKNLDLKQGLVAGILKAGEELKKHFPYQSDNVNELTNEISKGTL